MVIVSIQAEAPMTRALGVDHARASWRVLEVEKIGKPRPFSIVPAAAAVVVIIVIIVIIVGAALAWRRFGQGFLLDQGDQFFEFALVQPNAASGWAHVKLDAVTVDLTHWRAIDR